MNYINLLIAILNVTVFFYILFDLYYLCKEALNSELCVYFFSLKVSKSNEVDEEGTYGLLEASFSIIRV